MEGAVMKFMEEGEANRESLDGLAEAVSSAGSEIASAIHSLAEAISGRTV
jgi:hypothetical protein